MANPEWFRGMSSEEKEDFAKVLSESKTLLEVLEGILLFRLQQKDSKETSIEDYDKASWAYQQADINGSKRELKFLLQLIKSAGPQRKD